MKKETKKKVFNFVLVGTIVTSVATLLAVVLGKEANFFAVKEILKVGVKLNVWNWDDNQLKHTIKIGSETPNPELSMPRATWYISGFRYDNVETKFDSEKIRNW